MLPNWYFEYKDKIDKYLNNYLIEYFENEKNLWLNNLKEACLYACDWGKKIRAILALEFYLIFSWKKIEEIKDTDNISKFCIALELMHAYSLVHDDLPAMDNDTLRRGKPTVWSKYGEADAILVWDLLNSLSFEILSEIWNTDILKNFWQSVWIKWMIWGQTLDLYYEKNSNELNLENLIETHNKKTWALIQISIFWWIMIWNPSLKINKSNILEKYKDFWKKLGLAFQIKDDLLEVEWSSFETGKSLWEENKWFVYFMWLEKTKKYLCDLLKDCESLAKENTSSKISFLVKYIWERKK